MFDINHDSNNNKIETNYRDDLNECARNNRFNTFFYLTFSTRWRCKNPEP